MNVTGTTLHRARGNTPKYYDLILSCHHSARSTYKATTYVCWCEPGHRFALRMHGVTGCGWDDTGHAQDAAELIAAIPSKARYVQPWVTFAVVDRQTGRVVHQAGTGR